MSAVDSDVIPCTLAQSVRAWPSPRTGVAAQQQRHQRLIEGRKQLVELLLVPIGHHLAGWHAVLVEEVPELRPLLREREVGAGKPPQTLLRRSGGIGCSEPVGQVVEQARFDYEQQVVEILENIIECSGE
ncbi:MAG: hypothetical protein WDN31_20730 [Hyphomicrobium sp.]